MPTVSVIMPIYNVERYVERSIRSVLNQTYADFELILVDDGGTDGSMEICLRIMDPRIRIHAQKNRGLAGARSAGIRIARGDYIALLDSDDLWHREKLERHVAHLSRNPDVGISYSGSAMIDEDDRPIGVSMRPRLHHVDRAHVFCRNPIGNGSAPVIRRQVLDSIAFQTVRQGHQETWYFDETFRYGEDIECWMRMACQTSWRFEGIPGDLTLYRIVSGGLSANTEKMYEHWQRMFDKVERMAPELAADHGHRARGYQLRYYARRSVRERQGRAALRNFVAAMKCHPLMVFEEPGKTVVTGLAALATVFRPKAA